MHNYSSIAARHYASYRPPLHSIIVHEALDDMRFAKALDVGCGAGASTTALLHCCDNVIGLDPSPEMISQASPDPRIEYQVGSATDLPVSDCDLDLVSIAGALPYIDIGPFTAELERVCKPSARVLVYDFRVQLENLLQRLRLPATQSNGTYVHSMNLGDAAGFETVKEETRQIQFAAEPQQVAHLLLANETRFERLSAHFESSDPTETVVRLLTQKAPSYDLKATVWYALHRFA